MRLVEPNIKDSSRKLVAATPTTIWDARHCTVSRSRCYLLLLQFNACVLILFSPFCLSVPINLARQNDWVYLRHAQTIFPLSESLINGIDTVSIAENTLSPTMHLPIVVVVSGAGTHAKPVPTCFFLRHFQLVLHLHSVNSVLLLLFE